MIGPKVPKPTKREEAEAYELVTLRDHDTCQRCHGNCGPVQRDHRRNRSQGGWTVPSNLQCLGMGCHEWKSTHPREAWVEGWGVPSWADWSQWPARRWVRSGAGSLVAVYVLHDDVGGWVEITDAEARQRIDDGLVPF